MTAAGSIDVVVPAVAEFNLRSTPAHFDPRTEQSFLVRGAALSHESVFWGTGPRVLVLPEGVDQEWLDDVHAALGVPVPPIVTPAHRTGRLVRDLLHDPEALGALRAAVAGAAHVGLQTWGAIRELYQLAAVLGSAGAAVGLDISPAHSYWAGLYLESKSSCVELAGLVPGLEVAPGLTAAGWEEVTGAVGFITARYGRAIVRSNHGVGGDGSYVVGPGPSELQSFLTAARDDPFLRTPPLTVQQFVEHAPGTGCPAVDLMITDAGVSQLIPSVLRVAGHRLQSVDVGFGVLEPGLEDRVLSLGRRIADVAGDYGFRGWLGVDCIVATDGTLFVTEINARRTGAMAGIGLLGHRGTVDREVVHLSDELRLPAGRAVSYPEHVRPVFARHWAEGVAAYPMTVGSLHGPKPSIGLMVCAADAATAGQIADRIRAELVAAVTAAADTEASGRPATTP